MDETLLTLVFLGKNELGLAKVHIAPISSYIVRIYIYICNMPMSMGEPCNAILTVSISQFLLENTMRELNILKEHTLNELKSFPTW